MNKLAILFINYKFMFKIFKNPFLIAFLSGVFAIHLIREFDQNNTYTATRPILSKNKN